VLRARAPDAAVPVVATQVVATLAAGGTRGAVVVLEEPATPFAACPGPRGARSQTGPSWAAAVG